MSKAELQVNNIIATVFWLFMVASVLAEEHVFTQIAETEWYFWYQKLFLNLFVAAWVYFDSETYKFSDERRTLFALFSSVITEIALPVYLVKSRGWKGAAITSIRFIFYLIIAVVFMAVANAALVRL